MASLASAATVLPHFTGLKATQASHSRAFVAAAPTAAIAPPARGLSVKASLRDAVGAAAVAAGASLVLAGGNAMAMQVLLGGDDGSLAFVPSEFSISSGDTITFFNNAGFPHNVVFDEDEIPSGVDASKISMDESDLLNAKGDIYKVTLTKAGNYSFYCAPHQGAGMVGKVTVN